MNVWDSNSCWKKTNNFFRLPTTETNELDVLVWIHSGWPTVLPLTQTGHMMHLFEWHTDSQTFKFQLENLHLEVFLGNHLTVLKSSSLFCLGTLVYTWCNSVEFKHIFFSLLIWLTWAKKWHVTHYRPANWGLPGSCLRDLFGVILFVERYLCLKDLYLGVSKNAIS